MTVYYTEQALTVSEWGIEYIIIGGFFLQGPCLGNQLALAHSRLWDAVGGFLYIFAHMQDKLSKVSYKFINGEERPVLGISI